MNRITGECVVTDDKTGRVYNLEFDIKAITKLEAMVRPKGALDLIGGRPGMTDAICMLVAGVDGWNRRNGAGQKPLNANLAERLIVGAGGLAEIVDQLQLCLARGEGMGLFDGEAEDQQEAAEAEAAAGDADRPTGTPPTP